VLEGNEENQRVVAELQLQGSADVPEKFLHLALSGS